MDEDIDDVKGAEEGRGPMEVKKQTSVMDNVYKMQDLSKTELVETTDERDGRWIDWKTLWSYTGPGWLMSLAYLDPGNLEADLQQGAYTGYSLLWVLFWCTTMGLFLQLLAARLGVVTGKHLAQMCVDEKHGYSRPVAMALWVCTELAIIGSDVQEVVGSAIAFKIIFGFPLWVGALITACDTFTFLGLHAFGVRKLEAFIAVLIGTMCVCFWVTFVTSKPDVGEIIEGTIVPSAESYMGNQAVGTMGAVIMPHNIFLHSALVLSRQINRKDQRKVSEANKYNAIESSGSLFFSFIINLAVVGTYAATFFKKECAEEDGGPYAWVIQDDGQGQCAEIGLADTQEALDHTLGKASRYVPSHECAMSRDFITSNPSALTHTTDTRTIQIRLGYRTARRGTGVDHDGNVCRPVRNGGIPPVEGCGVEASRGDALHRAGALRPRCHRDQSQQANFG